MAKHNDPIGDRDIIIEFRQVGNSVKVSAIDPVTLTEVSIIGPANESRERLKTTVMQKLKYVIKRKSEGEPPADGNWV